MDSQDRDQYRTRRRQEMLARRVGDALNEIETRDAGECPDAEILAAYAEQALGRPNRPSGKAISRRARGAERFCACSPHRTDTPLAEKEVTPLEKLVSDVRTPVEVTGRSAGSALTRFWDWRARWLAPALGVAAVLVVWLAMRPPWRATDRGASETLVAQAPKEEVSPSPAPAELDQLSKAGTSAGPKSAPAPPPDRLSARAAPLNSPGGSPANGRADAAAALGQKFRQARMTQEVRLQKEKKLSALPDGSEVQPPTIPPPPPAPPKAQAAMEAAIRAPIRRQKMHTSDVGCGSSAG